MSALRASAGPRRAAAALLAVLALGSAAALAQPGPPIRLTPPRIIERDPPAPPAPAETPAQPPAGERPGEPAAPLIEVGRPPPVETESVGLADPAQLKLPANLWAGSGREVVDRLIATLPGTGVSTPARDLAKRLLIAAGLPPSSTTPSKESFVGLRAAKLLAMGDVESATGLARLVPGRAEDDTLAHVLLDAAFAAYDNSGACALTRARLTRLSDAYWQKALIFCQALAGEHARAQLGLSLLREQNAPEDAAFGRLVGLLAGETRAAVDRLPEATPLHLAMMRAARQNLPTDLATTSEPLVLRMIATSPNAALETRLLAAERAEAFGAVPAETLAQIYDSVPFTPEQLASALSFAEGDRGPRGRAILYRAAKAQTVGVARAEALQRSWRLARERGGYATAVRVALPLLLELPPAAELSFFAAEAVRALLLTGHVEEARRWQAVIRAEAAAGNELAATAETLLWPVVWLADAEGRRGDATPLAKRFEAWRQAQQRLEATAVRHRAPLVATLIFSSGERPDPAIVSPLLAGDLARESAPMPNLGLWLGIGAALEGGRVGETALFALALLGPEGAAGAAPHTIALVLDALRAAGLDAEARALAVEAAVAAGL
jgi:hypothetical protein